MSLNCTMWESATVRHRFPRGNPCVSWPISTGTITEDSLKDHPGIANGNGRSVAQMHAKRLDGRVKKSLITLGGKHSGN
jgi:hypothetical protein